MGIEKEDTRKAELIHQAYMSSELYTFLTGARDFFLGAIPRALKEYTSKIFRKNK